MPTHTRENMFRALLRGHLALLTDAMRDNGTLQPTTRLAGDRFDLTLRRRPDRLGRVVLELRAPVEQRFVVGRITACGQPEGALAENKTHPAKPPHLYVRGADLCWGFLCHEGIDAPVATVLADALECGRTRQAERETSDRRHPLATWPAIC